MENLWQLNDLTGFLNLVGFELDVGNLINAHYCWSSIEHGGTGTFSNIMAPLTPFNEALKCKDIAPLAL